jgi:hypothetical protein
LKQRIANSGSHQRKNSGMSTWMNFNRDLLKQKQKCTLGDWEWAAWASIQAPWTPKSLPLWWRGFNDYVNDMYIIVEISEKHEGISKIGNEEWFT